MKLIKEIVDYLTTVTWDEAALRKAASMPSNNVYKWIAVQPSGKVAAFYNKPHVHQGTHYRDNIQPGLIVAHPQDDTYPPMTGVVDIETLIEHLSRSIDEPRYNSNLYYHNLLVRSLTDRTIQALLMLSGQSDNSNNDSQHHPGNNDEGRSDGSTASYYQLPPGASELQDLISYRDMNAQIGEIFRSCYRYGRASHSDKLRDAKKIKFYIEAEIKRLEALTNV